jgi:hypothetical protein
MEIPKYKLYFEMDTCYDITEEIEIQNPDNSKIFLYPSKKTNKGAVVFEKDTLDQSVAEDEGRSKVNRFIDFFIASSNIDSLTPPRFPQKPELLNPESFKNKTKTVYAHLAATVNIVAPNPLAKATANTLKDMMTKVSKLNAQSQRAAYRSLFWLRKAAKASGEERFVYRWISLEALCAIYPETQASTQKTLNVVLNSCIKAETAESIYDQNRQIVNELVTADLTGRKGANPSRDLKRVLEKEAIPRVIVSKAVLCVFEVRNTLFHKGEVLSLIDGCSSFLRDIISKGLADVLQKVSV